MSRHAALYATLVLALAGCRSLPERAEGSARAAPLASAAVEVDTAYQSCRERIAALRKQPALPGAPEFDAQRADVLGRARGEPMVFVREPRATPDAALPKAALDAKKAFAHGSPFARVRGEKLRLRGDKPGLRALVLREGYVYSADPVEALALVTRLELPDLFDEETIYLQRGAKTLALSRVEAKPLRYQQSDGRTAELLFGDRVAVERADLAPPLHRDLRRLAHEIGFERAKITLRTAQGLVADLRFSGEWAKAVLDSDGAKLSLRCLAERQDRRTRFSRWIASDAPRRRGLARLRAAVDRELAEALPFDRPRHEETADRDGQLRPAWRWAYRAGLTAFSYDDESYPVYDVEGRPHPPQVCVDFVLDSYERASGTWFTAKGNTPTRVVGALDFDDLGIKNRRGVLAFEKFAEDSPELFEHLRFEAEDRVKFLERRRFFSFLVEHADTFRAGDVVAIQGRKGDGNIHQHAILIEDTDPVTGFPDALADQMKRPRRRTWEGIMAEAPLRSLLYRVRPKKRVTTQLER
ncbi:MAG: hypothetical protein KC776_01830 [Myxococcales bacterium]|nr:hypothetical protein [Myxococcales bacterium]MCB9579489.1 hypothetical protein [Polyangiaceae bacterium]